MADPRRFELDELVNRPGTYFNPQTEVLVVVDDSPELDAEIFNMEEYEGADWVLISDETPVDEHRRDELLETFQVQHTPRGRRRRRRRTTRSAEEDEEDAGGRRAASSAAARRCRSAATRTSASWRRRRRPPGCTGCSSDGSRARARARADRRRSSSTAAATPLRRAARRPRPGAAATNELSFAGTGCTGARWSARRSSGAGSGRRTASSARSGRAQAAEQRGELAGDRQRQLDRQLAHVLSLVPGPHVERWGCWTSLAIRLRSRARCPSRELARARDAERGGLLEERVQVASSAATLIAGADVGGAACRRRSRCRRPSGCQPVQRVDPELRQRPPDPELAPDCEASEEKLDSSFWKVAARQLVAGALQRHVAGVPVERIPSEPVLPSALTLIVEVRLRQLALAEALERPAEAERDRAAERARARRVDRQGEARDCRC